VRAFLGSAFLDTRRAEAIIGSMRRLSGRLLVGAVLAITVGASTARAAPEAEGARTLGMDGAIRGAATGSAAVFFNPAGMSLIRTYIPELDFEYLPAQKGHVEGVSVTDSLTSRVAAGLYYTHFSLQNQFAQAKTTNSGHEAGLALSMPLGDSFLIGETTKYLDATTVVPLGPPLGLDHRDRVIDEDVGVDIRSADVLSVALVGQNLFNPTRNTPRTLAGGVAILPAQIVLFDVDAAYDTSSGPGVRQKYMAAGELLVGDHYYLRSGFNWDVARQATYLSQGVSITTQQVAFDVGLREQTSGGRELAVAVSLRLFLNSFEDSAPTTEEPQE
jgi:hypothetical protein